MASTTVTFNDLIDEALSVLYEHSERPRQTSVGANALSTISDTNLTVADPSKVSVTDLIEMADGEQLLVTGRSDTDVFTVARGYNGTPASAEHVTSTQIVINPKYGRLEVERWVKRWFHVAGNVYLPNLATIVAYRTPGEQLVELPADTLDVVSVRAQGTGGRISDVGHWQVERDVPTTLYPTGIVMRVSVTLTDDDELWVTRVAPYVTSGISVDVPLGAEDLPILFAVAYGAARREVSRLDLDSVQEWNQAAAIGNGQQLRLIRELWGEYYRRLDDARRIHPVPKHRPYRKMPVIR